MNTTILGLLRSIRDGNADAILPLSDLLVEDGRESDADSLREIAAGSVCFEVANNGDTPLTINPDAEAGKERCRRAFALLGDTCPTCGGDGSYNVYEDVWRGNEIASVKHSSPCVSCYGSGVRLKVPRPVYTIGPEHSGKMLVFSTGGDATLTLPTNMPEVGFGVCISNDWTSAGHIDIVAPNGDCHRLSPAMSINLGDPLPEGAPASLVRVSV